MPSPSEHYRRAEELIHKAEDCVVASLTREFILAAQVHATLATCYQPDDEYTAETAVDCMLARGDVTGQITELQTTNEVL